MIALAPRLEVSLARRLAIPVLAIAISVGAWSLLLAAQGRDPVRAARVAARSVGSSFGVSRALLHAVPIALCAAGIAVAATMRLWNIGAEGQLAIGALAATGIALESGLPPALLLPGALLAGTAAGAVWGGMAGFLRARFGTSEILTTLMLNYVALHAVALLVYGPWKGPDNFPYTALVPESARFARLGEGQLHTGAFLAAAIVLSIGAWLRWSVWGYEVRVAGESWETARYAAIPLARRIAGAMALAGAAAGLAGAIQIAGVHHRLDAGTTPGYGYTAIVVACLARRSVPGSLFVAIAFGALVVAGEELEILLGVPSSSIRILQSMILLSVLGTDLLVTHRVVRRAT